MQTTISGDSGRGLAWAGPIAAGEDVCRSLYAERKVRPQIDRLKMGLDWLKNNCPSRVNRRTEETAPSEGFDDRAGPPYHRHITASAPLLPELITEGDTLAEALANVEDAYGAVVEIYRDRGRPLPSSLYLDDANGPLTVETIVSVP